MFERSEDGGSIAVKTFEQIVREEQRSFRAVVGPSYTVDQFIADRRADWGQEG